jgi:hypothetical protein
MVPQAGGVGGRGLCLTIGVPVPRSREAKRRQLQGSRRGSAAVQREFAAAITRRRFCELVGIHAKTLKRWERLGIVEGRLVPILNSPTRVFSESDVRFGRKLIALLRSRPGELSVADAARTLRPDTGGSKAI